jgi:cytochrome c553
MNIPENEEEKQREKAITKLEQHFAEQAMDKRWEDTYEQSRRGNYCYTA